MKLVAAKCPSCGANIDVDANSDSTKCEYCHTKIIVDEAIQKLKVELSGEVEVKNLPKASALLKNGARYYKNGEYDEAYKQYSKAIELEPDNYIAVLRSGICKSLDTNYMNYDINPLSSAMKEAFDLVKDADGNENANQIAKESCDAVVIMVNFAINFYNKGLLDHQDLLDNQQKLFDCLKCYNTAVSFVKDNDSLKSSIYKNIIELSDYLIKGKKYKTGNYRNGNEVIGNYVPNKSFEKTLYNIRNSAVTEYNKLNPQGQYALKNQPSIRKDSKTGKAIGIAIAVVALLFVGIIGIIVDSTPLSTYDYELKCEGLEVLNLDELSKDYKDDLSKAKEKYKDKAFILEGNVYLITKSDEHPEVEIKVKNLRPDIYVNLSQKEKLYNYKSNDKIKVCGIVTVMEESGKVRLENATIID